MGRGKPFLPNVEAILAAGLDPKSGLPIKMSSALYTHKKEDIKRLLRIKDEQDAVNRYTWYNLPEGLSSQELERMLYYKGQLCFLSLTISITSCLMP